MDLCAAITESTTMSFMSQVMPFFLLFLTFGKCCSQSGNYFRFDVETNTPAVEVRSDTMPEVCEPLYVSFDTSN